VVPPTVNEKDKVNPLLNPSQNPDSKPKYITPGGMNLQSFEKISSKISTGELLRSRKVLFFC
jgi:hypothetical protein